MNNTDLSILTLIVHASLLVQGVMLLLVLLSVMSWFTLVKKWVELRYAKRYSTMFEQLFWSGIDLNGLYQKIQQQHQLNQIPLKNVPPTSINDVNIITPLSNPTNTAQAPTASETHQASLSTQTPTVFSKPLNSPLSRIFEAGMQNYVKARQSRPDDSELWLEVAYRAMYAAHGRELATLDKGLSLLANIGSISPYIGLFGTVWGIMNSFRGLSTAQQSTLSSVAPGIAEALVATAIGLFSAIPATVAYNRYASEVDALSGQFEHFIQEFMNILQRQSR